MRGAGMSGTPGPASGLQVDLVLRRGSTTIAAALDAEPGRPLALVGPNGAGKSSLLAAVAGLVPARGTVSIGRRPLQDLPPERRGLGVVFQDLLLFRHLTVRDNVAFAQRLSVGARRARETTEVWLDRIGIAGLAERYPHELSGGQAQRVALARALAAEPSALLLDEPMAALDVELRAELRTELGDLLRNLAVPVVTVTHSLLDVQALADEVVVLEAGAVTQRGVLAELSAHPATPYVARLTAARED